MSTPSLTPGVSPPSPVIGFLVGYAPVPAFSGSTAQLWRSLGVYPKLFENGLPELAADGRVLNDVREFQSGLSSDIPTSGARTPDSGLLSITVQTDLTSFSPSLFSALLPTAEDEPGADQTTFGWLPINIIRGSGTNFSFTDLFDNPSAALYSIASYVNAKLLAPGSYGNKVCAGNLAYCEAELAPAQANYDSFAITRAGIAIGIVGLGSQASAPLVVVVPWQQVSASLSGFGTQAEEHLSQAALVSAPPPLKTD